MRRGLAIGTVVLNGGGSLFLSKETSLPSNFVLGQQYVMALVHERGMSV